MANAVAQADANAVQRAWSVVTGMVGGLKDTLSTVGQAAIGKLAELWSGLGRQFNGVLSSIGNTANSLIGGLNNAAQSVTSRIQAGWSGLQRRASQIGGVAGAIASVVQAVVNTILQATQRIWGDIQGLWSGLRQRISGLWRSVQAKARAAWSAVTQRARSAWASIGASWGTLRTAVTSKVQGMLGKFGDVWRRISGFSIDRLVQALTRAAPFIAQLRTAIADPMSILEPIVSKLANQLRAEVPGKSREVLLQHIDQSRGSAAAAQPAAISAPIMRLVDLSAASAGGAVIQRAAVGDQRSTETLPALWHGLSETFTDKWEKLDLLGMLWDAVTTLFWPPTTLKVIVAEFGEMWEELTASRPTRKWPSGLGCLCSRLWSTRLPIVSKKSNGVLPSDSNGLRQPRACNRQ